MVSYRRLGFDMRIKIFAALIGGAMIALSAPLARAAVVTPTLTEGQPDSQNFNVGTSYTFTFYGNVGEYFDIALAAPGVGDEWSVNGTINGVPQGPYIVTSPLSTSYKLTTAGTYDVTVQLLTAHTDPTGVFEISENPVSLSATPVPAALPLFAAGFGTIGLLGWRRKEQKQDSPRCCLTGISGSF
jgi:hypothetical protein